MLGLEQASKRYSLRGRWVLDRVDLTVAPGALIEVRGANGSGKSTLLRLLAGVTVPSRGRRVGVPTVGYAPDRLDPAPPFVGRAYLEHYARMRAVAPAVIAPLGERLGVGDLLDEPLRELSAGSLQKVTLIGALLADPQLLVLDEPFSGLDQDAQATLCALMSERAQAGAAVVFSDHRPAGGASPAPDTTWQVAQAGVRVGATVADERSVAITIDPADSDAKLAELIAAGWHVVAVERRADRVWIAAERDAP